ncbi:hypothetical protein T11_331 [Trichinella zimbabwensis]|uniref:Uncharacterized protein n=1 Tax=Trichinella zimbabwensis TaxID=268475 RepID=A0A0V1GMP7_9BILA|nr:hypothetical protein T11_331 [Trichinella zimbabwensis]
MHQLELISQLVYSVMESQKISSSKILQYQRNGLVLDDFLPYAT